jgi:GST-like protein
MEEMELAWELVLIDILNGDQLTPEFLKLNPNNKTPAIVDHDGPGGKPFTLWETAAILWYLGEKTGKFLPTEPRARAICHQWLAFQVSGVGPMFGQHAHFTYYAKEKHPYSMDRYHRETVRLMSVIDKRLEESAYIAGPDYTIADMALYPYLIRRVSEERAGGKYPSLIRWFDKMSARPAVLRGCDVGKDHVRKETIRGGLAGLTDDQMSALWGEKQHARNT